MISTVKKFQWDYLRTRFFIACTLVVAVITVIFTWSLAVTWSATGSTSVIAITWSTSASVSWTRTAVSVTSAVSITRVTSSPSVVPTTISVTWSAASSFTRSTSLSFTRFAARSLVVSVSLSINDFALFFVFGWSARIGGIKLFQLLCKFFVLAHCEARQEDVEELGLRQQLAHHFADCAGTRTAHTECDDFRVKQIILVKVPQLCGRST